MLLIARKDKYMWEKHPKLMKEKMELSIQKKFFCGTGD
jgi:hypothetical protein